MSSPRLLAVVHLEDATHAAAQSELAIANGADGVFLINHFGPPDVLGEALESVRARVGDVWVGLNPLGLDCVGAASFVKQVHDVVHVDGLWCDNAAIDESQPVESQEQARAAEERRVGWSGTYFGGVAFKYQRKVTNLERAARTASQLMDVVCTSGPGTGQPADVGQLESLRRGLESSSQLAVASGVTAKNVGVQLDYCHWFLVATGISKTYTELDPDLVRALAARIHQPSA